MYKLSYSLVVFLSIALNVAFAVQDSVIPLMEQFEYVENLPSNRMTKNQIKEISRALDQKENKIRLVTYNMLFDKYDHNLDEKNRWPQRLPRIVELLQEMQPDIISTQELYPNQVEQLCKRMEEEFNFFTGRKDNQSESYGIFYRKDRFKLISSKFSYPVAMITLQDLKTNRVVSVFNTHMPFADIEKREKNARAIVRMIQPVADKMACLFTGDLNTFSNRLELANLPFYDGDYIHKILSKDGVIKDSHSQSLLGHFGPLSTFTNKDHDTKPFRGTGTPGMILDYIYVSDKVTVLTHAIEKGKVKGHFPSDHMPVVIDFLIK